ncbi:MAG TPA: glycosyltransferase family 4 protein [Mycobacteriales bacterium]|nr:glycosyltransferase family 4 protein [Mycobacteriales bacterium]
MGDALRIAVVVGPTSGGIGRHVHAVVRQLVAQGHFVVVVAPSATDDLLGWRATGARLVTTPVGESSPAAVGRAVSSIRAAAKGVDVIHAHGVRAGAVAALARVHPLVVTWHNARPARWQRRLVHPVAERLAARASDVALAVSPDLLARARQAGAGHAALVPAPAPEVPAPSRVPAEVRASLGVGDRPLVLAVARLEAQKRLDLLVDATAGWASRPDGPVVAVAGTGRLAETLTRRAKTVGSPLVLLGRRDDVPDLMRAADLVVLPSAWEGYPLAAQEALQLGVPLVATAVGGVPTLVGDAARLVVPGDPAALRTALEELLRDESERARLSRAGVQRAATWPTLAASVNELVGIYRNLVVR